MMTKREFLVKLPVGAAFAFSILCSASCNQAERLEVETNRNKLLRTDTITNPDLLKINFVIDLDDPLYIKLKNMGGYVFYQGVIIVFTEEGKYIAATKICSDEFLPRIIWEEGEYLCEAHGATFDRNGLGTDTYNDLGKKGIEIYITELKGTKLRIFSKI